MTITGLRCQNERLPLDAAPSLTPSGGESGGALGSGCSLSELLIMGIPQCRILPSLFRFRQSSSPSSLAVADLRVL